MESIRPDKTERGKASLEQINNEFFCSKLLRGHMRSVIHVQFITNRGQVLSLSKDKILRIWDIQLQICLQRMSNMFPRGPDGESNA